MDKKRQTIDLTDEELENLRQIAERFGLTSSRGPTAGQGSPQYLNQAIAQGRLLVFENPAYNGHS